MCRQTWSGSRAGVFVACVLMIACTSDKLSQTDMTTPHEANATDDSHGARFPDSTALGDGLVQDQRLPRDAAQLDSRADAPVGDRGLAQDLGLEPDTASSKPCPVLPADDPWNTDISKLPLRPDSATLIEHMGPSDGLKADFGTVWQGAPNGIPYVVVRADQPLLPIVFYLYANQSDPGPYPIPRDAPIEGGPSATGDRHVIGLDPTRCKLYELFKATPSAEGWRAANGAVFDLRRRSPTRPIGWTSADAAGLPIYPGLVRREEVQTGAIRHALRVTFAETRRAFILPATHYASSNTSANLPPMGLRLRLKQRVDISGYSSANQVILRALKTYGLIVADNGSNWYISGAPDPAWDDDDLQRLRQIKGSEFEVVDTGAIHTSYDVTP